MLNNWTNREDTYIVPKIHENSKFTFLDECCFVLPLNTNVNNNDVLVLEAVNGSTIKLKWVSLDQHEHVKELLNKINNLNDKNNALNQQILILESKNNDLTTTVTNNENNIIKVNSKILDEHKINEIISSRLNMFSSCIYDKIKVIEQTLKTKEDIKENASNTIKADTINAEDIKENASNTIKAEDVNDTINAEDIKENASNTIKAEDVNGTINAEDIKENANTINEEDIKENIEEIKGKTPKSKAKANTKKK